MELNKEGLTFVEYAQRIINSYIKFAKELHGQYGHSEFIVVNRAKSQYI